MQEMLPEASGGRCLVRYRFTETQVANSKDDTRRLEGLAWLDGATGAPFSRGERRAAEVFSFLTTPRSARTPRPRRTMAEPAPFLREGNASLLRLVLASSWPLAAKSASHRIYDGGLVKIFLAQKNSSLTHRQLASPKRSNVSTPSLPWVRMYHVSFGHNEYTGLTREDDANDTPRARERGKRKEGVAMTILGNRVQRLLATIVVTFAVTMASAAPTWAGGCRIVNSTTMCDACCN